MSLRAKLVRFRRMKGKTETDFCQRLGDYERLLTFDDGSRLLWWHHTTLFTPQAIAILFDSNRRFVRVVSRFGC
jgi:hypothetical protein